jgi:hypothetical protein
VWHIHKQAKGQTGPLLRCVTHILPPFHQLLAPHVNFPNKHLKKTKTILDIIINKTGNNTHIKKYLILQVLYKITKGFINTAEIRNILILKKQTTGHLYTVPHIKNKYRLHKIINMKTYWYDKISNM